MTSILFMTNTREPPPGGCLGEDVLMRAQFIYLILGCNFLIFRLLNIPACSTNVSTPYVGKCGGYCGWDMNGSLGNCENGMHEMGKDLVGG